MIFSENRYPLFRIMLQSLGSPSLAPALPSKRRRGPLIFWQSVSILVMPAKAGIQ